MNWKKICAIMSIIIGLLAIFGVMISIGDGGTKQMNEDRFWAIIEESRQGVFDLPEDEQAEKLIEILIKESPENILEFDKILTRKMDESYISDLWAIGYIVNGGCSDDGFEYFRSWIISQGKGFYEKALADPESIAEFTDPEKIYENVFLLVYVAHDAYKAVTGDQMPPPDLNCPRELTGRPWNEEYLPRLFPKACKKYGLKYKTEAIPRTADKDHVEAIARGLEDDNGAKYYLMAWLAYARSPEYHRLGGVRHYRYEMDMQVNYEESTIQDSIHRLEDGISNSEPALQLIRQGTTNVKFAFPPDLRLDYWCGDIVNDILDLMVGKSIVFEERKDYRQATEANLDLLRFARNISDNTSIRPSPSSSFRIERLANLHLRRYVKNLNDIELCYELIEVLLAMMLNRASPRCLLENEVLYQKREHKRAMPREREETLPLMAKQFFKDYDDFMEAQLNVVDRPFPEAIKSLKFYLRPPFDRVYQGNNIYLITRAEAVWQATILVTALRIWFLKEGAYPENLEELDSIIPNHVIIDPFSTKPFRYKKKKNDEYILYSIGPDRTDHGGMPMDPHSAEIDGDIFF